jgi:hypothetical protein
VVKNDKLKEDTFDKSILESLIHEELENNSFPLKTDVKTYYYSDLHPKEHTNNKEFSIYTQIDVENFFGDIRREKSESSYLDFFYIPKRRIIEHINLRLAKTMQHKGYARTLITTIENVGRRLNCTIVRVNFNMNKSFWNHMGYEFNGSYWDKKI